MPPSAFPFTAFCNVKGGVLSAVWLPLTATVLSAHDVGVN